MQVLVINESNLKISIKDYYRLVDGGGGGAAIGYYGSVHYTLKHNEHKLIDPSYFKKLSKEMFAPVEVRVCGGRDNQFISFSPLQLEHCDGIVINADKDGELTHKFVERRKAYSHEWIKSWVPALGVKERKQHILSASSSQPADNPSQAKPST